MNPRLRRNGDLLTREEGDRVLRGITSEDCHLLGRVQPEEVEDRCLRDKSLLTRRHIGPNYGQHMGHGSCLYLKFIKKQMPCAGCAARTITEQLNWLFANRRRFEGLTAEWPQKKRKVA